MRFMWAAMDSGRVIHLTMSFLHFSNKIPKFLVKRDEKEGAISTQRYLKPLLTILNGKCGAGISVAALLRGNILLFSKMIL